MKKTAKPAAPALPPGIKPEDMNYPAAGRSLPYEKLKELGLGYEAGWSGVLTFYHCANARRAPEWVLTTLRISGAGRGATERYYGIGVADSKTYTVGRGPHVTTVVEVRPSADNLDRLLPYLGLWKKGMADASAVRDRISSRRAQGQLHRAAGRTSWTW